jgi:serine/threonine protein phosphatase PrpC
MRAIALMGKDWPDLGPLALAELPDGGALALSRGAEPKAYPHTDPNEDAALLVRTDAGVLLAVADGFNGSEVSELAIAQTRARATELVQASGEAFRAEVLRLVDAVRGALPRWSRSRSCLVIAALRGDRLELASFGDSSAWLVGSGDALAGENTLLLGDPEPLARARVELWHAQLERPAGARIALVSDGVTNFAAALSIPGLLAAAPNDLEAARAIAQAAFSGGAGDNVAVAAFGGRAGV